MELEAMGIDYSPEMNAKLLKKASKDKRTVSIMVKALDLRNED